MAIHILPGVARVKERMNLELTGIDRFQQICEITLYRLNTSVSCNRIDKLYVLVVNLAKVVDIDLREISIELSEAFLKSHCKKIRNNWGFMLDNTDIGKP